MMSKRYIVGTDAERVWEVDRLDAAYATAAVESIGSAAVVSEVHDHGSLTVIAVYRDGTPEGKQA